MSLMRRTMLQRALKRHVTSEWWLIISPRESISSLWEMVVMLNCWTFSHSMDWSCHSEDIVSSKYASKPLAFHPSCYFHWRPVSCLLSMCKATGFWNVIQGFAGVWVPDIFRSQLQKCMEGIPPFRSLFNIGTGFADLVVMPLKQYRKDRRLMWGMSHYTFFSLAPFWWKYWYWTTRVCCLNDW